MTTLESISSHEISDRQSQTELTIVTELNKSGKEKEVKIDLSGEKVKQTVLP